MIHISSISEFKELITKSKNKNLIEPLEKNGQSYLKLSNIEVDEGVFQPRIPDWDNQLDYHVDNLLRVLKQGKHLDPIIVWGVAGQWYCIDGHQRLKAYEKYYQYKKFSSEKHLIPIFIKSFNSVEEAVVGAFQENVKDKKPLTRIEKNEVMWAMVKMGKSWREVSDYSTISRRSYQNMVRLKKDIIEKHLYNEDMSYISALTSANESEDRDMDYYDVLEIAQGMKKALSKALGKTPHNNIEAMTYALEDYLGGRFWDMIFKAVENRDDMWDDMEEAIKQCRIDNSPFNITIEDKPLMIEKAKEEKQKLNDLL